MKIFHSIGIIADIVYYVAVDLLPKMSRSDKTKPFNLLYRFEPQKSSIDKLYEFVVFEGRIIVMVVMAIIIAAFVYRFPLDAKLNDEKNRSAINLRELSYYVNRENQKEYISLDLRASSAKKFIDIYSRTKTLTDNPRMDPSTVNSQIKLSELLKKINEIDKSFGDDIVVISYSYDVISTKNMGLSVNGYASTFTKAEEFREKIKTEKTYVRDVLIQDLGSTKDEKPKFNIDVKIK